MFPGFAQRHKVAITDEVLELLEAAGMAAAKKAKPGEYSLPQNSARMLRNLETIRGLVHDTEFMKVFPITLAIGSCFVQAVYEDTARRRFGTTELNMGQIFWTAGATLESIGRMLKQRKPIATEKGRANVERLELIKKIRAHQVKKLTPKEIKQALEIAGHYVSPTEALRLFEWRRNSPQLRKFCSQTVLQKVSRSTWHVSASDLFSAGLIGSPVSKTPSANAMRSQFDRSVVANPRLLARLRDELRC